MHFQKFQKLRFVSLNKKFQKKKKKKKKKKKNSKKIKKSKHFGKKKSELIIMNYFIDKRLFQN